MKNNFDLKKFLTENKLTTNSKILKENFAPSANSGMPDANGEDFDVATAFKKAGVDMSKPVMVIHTYGSAAYGGGDETEMSPEAAIKKLEADRQENQNMLDGEPIPEDHHGYEFENYSILVDDMPEGYEYKLAYYLTGEHEYAIVQEKSVDSKNETWGFQSDFAKDLEKRGEASGGGVPALKAVPKVLKVSMGPNAKKEQQVIDIARDAIALMDEQPGTSAKQALMSVLGNY
jgi:hypothetical protein